MQSTSQQLEAAQAAEHCSENTALQAEARCLAKEMESLQSLHGFSTSGDEARSLVDQQNQEASPSADFTSTPKKNGILPPIPSMIESQPASANALSQGRADDPQAPQATPGMTL